PRLGVGDPHVLTPLLREGFANDPAFGGVGPQPIGQLGFGQAFGPGQVYETLVPEGSTRFNVSFTRGGTLFTGSTADLSSGPFFAPAATPPTADGQSLITPEDIPAALTLTGSSGQNDPLTFTVASPPAHGTLSGTAPNLVYTPAPGYFGPDAF